jgi:tetratricopeptide (TPR) repeat protein
MAIVIDAFSVVVRTSTLADKYPGGLEGYWQDCPNSSFCADEHLSRVAFMALSDADRFVAELAAKGLTPSRKDAAEDVALLSPSDGFLQPCAWLELGRWGPVAIAWLGGTTQGDVHAPAGWNADSTLRMITPEEAAQRFEFVRSEDKLDIYRDKTTGETFYVGRTASTSKSSKSRHNELYQRASQLIEGLILLDDRPPAPLDASNRSRLESAIPLFEEVVQINPGNWPAMWLLGKIYQRLSNYDSALAWFSRSHRVNPDHVDVAREAAIAAMDAGRPTEAIDYCRRALETQPEDAGLHANLAVALLFSGNPSEAKAAAAEATRRNPSDQITRQIVTIINEVLAGARPCPHHARDLE